MNPKNNPLVASPLFSALREGFQKMLGRFDVLTKAVKDNRVDITPAILEQTRALQTVGTRIEKALSRIQEPSFDVHIDQKDILIELRAISKSLAKLKVPETANIEALLKLVLTTLKEHKHKDMGGELMKLTKAMKDIKTYETVKIDDAQIKALMASSQGTIVSGNSILAARSVTVANTSMTSANTEYSYTFPANTVAWELRLRENNIPLLIAYATGKLPTSGDGSAYFTVPAYYIQQNTGMDWGGKTIYLQTGSASQVLETISYRAT